MAEISIIVAVYNVESYIRRCVGSILAQTKEDYELILVDDGSSDRSGEICDTYSQVYEHIHVIHQNNEGLSAARNAGIEWAFKCSESNWITFIDSDDWVVPEYLEILYWAVKRDKTNISIGEYLETDGTPLPNVKEFESIVCDPLSFYKEKTVNATVSWGKLYSKKLFSNIRFPKGKVHEDEYVTYRILFDEKKISIIETPIYAYFINMNGITRGEWGLQRMDSLEAIEQQVDFFIEHEHYDIAQERLRILLDQYLYDYYQIKQNKEYQNKMPLKDVKRDLKRVIEKYRSYGWISPINRGVDLSAYAVVYLGMGFMKSSYAFAKRIIRF